jgi:hypothetical protein
MSGNIPNSKRALYFITCKIGKYDYTKNLQRVRIVGSLASLYHVLLLELMIEGEHLANREDFGQTDVRLSIINTHDPNDVGNVINMDLLVIHMKNLGLKRKPQQSINQDKTFSSPEKILLCCVPKKSFVNMTTMVNKCFQEGFRKIPSETDPNKKVDAHTIDMFKKVVSEFLTDMDYNISTKDKNTNLIPRTFNISRMNFSNFVRYLDGDELGGLYNSPAIIFHGLSQFYVNSMKHAISQAPDFIVHLLAAPMDATTEQKIISRSTRNENEFYTKMNIITKNKGSSNTANCGGKKVVTVLPTDTLYSRLYIEADKLMDTNVPRAAKKSLDYVSEVIKNMESYEFTPGYELSDNFMRNKMAKYLANISEIQIKLTRNLVLNKLIDPGKCMELKTYSEDYSLYQGNYIVAAVNIELRRQESELYMCSCDIRAVRSNILI